MEAKNKMGIIEKNLTGCLNTIASNNTANIIAKFEIDFDSIANSVLQIGFLLCGLIATCLAFLVDTLKVNSILLVIVRSILNLIVCLYWVICIGGIIHKINK
jgi:hypothetical protein